MKKRKKKIPTIVIDSREKKPWDWDNDIEFDGVVTEKLDVGDYSIKGLERVISIERKRSVDELCTNMFTKGNRERLRREMERFQDIKHRFIIVEETLSDALNPNHYYVNKARKNRFSPKMPIAIIMRELIDFMLNYGIHVIFAGDNGHSLAKKILLQAYDDYEREHQEDSNE